MNLPQANSNLGQERPPAGSQLSELHGIILNNISRSQEHYSRLLNILDKWDPIPKDTEATQSEKQPISGAKNILFDAALTQEKLNTKISQLITYLESIV